MAKIDKLESAKSASARLPYEMASIHSSSTQNGISSYVLGSVASGKPVCVVSSEGIVASGYGAVSISGSAYALYDSSDGTPSVGDILHAKSSDKKLRTSDSGSVARFLVLESPNTTRKTVRVFFLSAESSGSPTQEDHPHIVAVVGADFTEEDNQVQISSVRAYIGMDPLSEDPETVKNQFELVGKENQGVLLVPSNPTPSWEASTSYTAGDKVRHTTTTAATSLTAIYRRKTTGTSGASFVSSNWDLIAREDAPEWQPSTVYATNDTVKMIDPTLGGTTKYIWTLANSRVSATLWGSDYFYWNREEEAKPYDSDWEIAARYARNSSGQTIAVARIADNKLEASDESQLCMDFLTTGEVPENITDGTLAALNPNDIESNVGDYVLLHEREENGFKVYDIVNAIHQRPIVAMALIGGSSDLADTDTVHTIEEFRLIVGVGDNPATISTPPSYPPDTAQNPDDLEAPLGQEVIVVSEDSGLTWQIKHIPNIANNGIAVVIANEDFDDTDDDVFVDSTETEMIITPLGKNKQFVGSSVYNTGDYVGFNGDMLLVKYDKITKQWEIARNITKKMAPLIPGLAVTNIDAASYDNGSFQPTTTGTVILLNYNNTQGETITNIFWPSKTQITASTLNPVFVWLQRRNDRYEIIAQDKLCP